MEKRFIQISAAERRRNRFRNVTLTTHEGKAVKFYDDLLKDKTVLLNSFYTNCVAEAICPLTTANLVEVQRLLGPRSAGTSSCTPSPWTRSMIPPRSSRSPPGRSR